MCGIAGALRLAAEGTAGAAPGALTELGAAMADELVHRGPDAGGVWTDEPAGLVLAHRRLSIIELSAAGAQPMRSACGRFTLVFNGEIYNHLELRRALGADPYRVRSDTETLVAACAQWGLRATLERASGMFALALWDAQERVLELARDRLGEKPLVYAQLAGDLAFASQTRALRRHPAWRGGLDRESLALYLRYGYLPDPCSIHAGVQQLPPGHMLRVAGGVIGAPQAWWRLATVVATGAQQPFTGGEEDATTELGRRLEQVVAEQLVADVPLGALLSGGIDSRLVVGVMSRLSGRPVRTFTIASPDDPRYDESTQAAAIARHLGASHTQLCITPAQALAVVGELSTVYDEPFADPAAVPTLLLARMVRAHVTVAMSGDGGDELLAGYHRHVVLPHLFSRVGWIPRAVRRLAGGVLSAVPSACYDGAYRLLRGGGIRLLGDKVHKLARALGAGDVADLHRRVTSVWERPAQLLGAGAEASAWADRECAAMPPQPLLERMLARDQLGFLPADGMVKVDRAAMAVGLEVRLPLCDHRLMEFAWRLPGTLKVRAGRGKLLLRKLSERYVPPELGTGGKVGFGVPLDAWLRGPLREWAEELLSERRLAADGLLDPAPIRAAWHAHLAGWRDRFYPLWTVLMLQLWRERWTGAR